jgi:hypothetical protein
VRVEQSCKTKDCRQESQIFAVHLVRVSLCYLHLMRAYA